MLNFNVQVETSLARIRLGALFVRTGVLASNLICTTAEVTFAAIAVALSCQLLEVFSVELFNLHDLIQDFVTLVSLLLHHLHKLFVLEEHPPVHGVEVEFWVPVRHFSITALRQLLSESLNIVVAFESI